WERQARDNAALTDRHKQAIHRAIFFQRPLKSQRGLVGRCSLERGRRRAPEACLEFQEFRYLQRVNDLEVRDVDGWRRLTAEERRRLTDALDVHEKLTFSQIRRLLGFRRPRGDRFLYEFNLEAGGESKLMGNQTAARLRSILGDRWDAMPPDRRKEFVDEIISFRDEQALVRRLQRAWDLDETMAGQVVDVPLPSNFASFSRKALRRLLPRLHAGERLQTAIKNEYGPRETHTVYDRLPPVREAMSELRNPVVCRALTELRRVVNAIVARYGKPQAIRVELARDLKMSRERRKQRWKQMRENERKRDAAKERVIRELGIQQPRNTHILKVILAEECNWECPYTGRTISMEALIGSHPQFDIEHIIPFSRSLDDSIVNKTLCYHEENRERKRGRTPWEAYGGDEQRWHEILSRVGRFQGPLAKRKFELFALTEVTDEFVNRQLSDTRYITRAAVEYLGLLYGGVIDESGKRRVQTTTGPVTSQMARAWGLGRILGPGSGKNRDDHRHHAVDAIVIALTDAAVIQRYSRASQQSESRLGRIQVELPEPWPDFVQSVQRAIDCIVVSHRAKRRLSGALHEETNYGIRNVLRPNGRVDQVVTVRKRLDQMSSEEVQRIIDPVVRQLVLEKLKAVTGRENADPKRVFAVPENLPHRTDRAGNVFPVRAARIQARRTVQPIGSPAKRRYVAPGSNSHMEIVAELDTQGRELRWEGHIVSRLEAYARYRAGEPVVKRDHGPNKRFLFSLRPTEMVEMNYQGQRNIFKVEAISSRQLEFVLHSDARPSSVRRKQSGQRVRLSPDRLRSARARKVVVDPLGKILPAND
ncbi:MAG: type II CRISPR RNA-guided endonuclease Cas9, partial [Planctomycetota bacterium]